MDDLLIIKSIEGVSGYQTRLVYTSLRVQKLLHSVPDCPVLRAAQGDLADQLR